MSIVETMFISGGQWLIVNKTNFNMKFLILTPYVVPLAKLSVQLCHLTRVLVLGTAWLILLEESVAGCALCDCLLIICAC